MKQSTEEIKRLHAEIIAREIAWVNMINGWKK
jgi:hypothetical protein